MNKFDKFDKFYICNYTPLKERKQFMIEQNTKYNLQNKLHFINEFDRENIPNKFLDIFDTSKLKLCEISLFLKHIEGMRLIHESNKEFGIIMEDDVVYKDNFFNNFNQKYDIFPDDFDILYIGVFPFNKYFKERGTRNNTVPDNSYKVGSLYNMKKVEVFPWTGNNKGTDFYIISKKCCEMFISIIKNCMVNKKKINLPIDHFMGQLTFNKDSNIYWSKDEITCHGSWSGEGGLNMFKNSMDGRENAPVNKINL